MAEKKLTIAQDFRTVALPDHSSLHVAIVDPEPRQDVKRQRKQLLIAPRSDTEVGMPTVDRARAPALGSGCVRVEEGERVDATLEGRVADRDEAGLRGDRVWGGTTGGVVCWKQQIEPKVEG